MKLSNPVKHQQRQLPLFQRAIINRRVSFYQTQHGYKVIRAHRQKIIFKSGIPVLVSFTSTTCIESWVNSKFYHKNFMYKREVRVWQEIGNSFMHCS